MSPFRVAIFGDGESELGPKAGWQQPCAAPNLPALPCLVHRLAEAPEDAVYVPGLFKPAQHAHRSGQQSRMSRKLARALAGACRKGYSAMVVLVDRDTPENAGRIAEMRAGRESVRPEYYLPCAVGEAVYSLDAWILADADAIAKAGGAANELPAKPEGLPAEESKRLATRAFPAADNMTDAYSVVAREANLDVLERRCPQGFAPFAAEVRERIGPAVAGDDAGNGAAPPAT